MTINTTNIQNHLSTLTSTQLTKELNRVSNLYQGFQVNALSQTSYDSWMAWIALIEEEQDRRG